MKLTFNIEYRTHWGESLYLVADTPMFGGGDIAKALKMSVRDGALWTITVDLPEGVQPFDYRYIVRTDEGQIKNEWGAPRHFVPAPGVHSVVVYDRWQDQPFDKPFYSSAFTGCITRHTESSIPLRIATGDVTFIVAAPACPPYGML